MKKFIQASSNLSCSIPLCIRPQRVLLLLFFLLFLVGSASAVTYTVIAFRGGLKINNQIPTIGETTFTDRIQIKFKRTSDYVVAKDENGYFHNFTPIKFQKDINKGKLCSGNNCTPKMSPGPIAGPFILAINFRGSILVNNEIVKVNERLTLDSRITFDKTSDFLIVKQENGEVLLIRPERFDEDERLSKKCIGDACKTTQEPAEVVRRTRPAFYEQHIKPFIKP